MKKEIWYGYDSLQFQPKKNYYIFGMKCFHEKKSSLLATLIFFVEHPQMVKSGEKGKGC